MAQKDSSNCKLLEQNSAFLVHKQCVFGTAVDSRASGCDGSRHSVVQSSAFLVHKQCVFSTAVDSRASGCDESRRSVVHDHTWELVLY